MSQEAAKAILAELEKHKMLRKAWAHIHPDIKDDIVKTWARIISSTEDGRIMVEVERIPQSAMYMKTEAATGEYDGREFSVYNNTFGGDLLVEFDRAEGEVENELSHDRFIVKTRSVMMGCLRAMGHEPTEPGS